MVDSHVIQMVGLRPRSSYKKMTGRFFGPHKFGRNDEVVVLMQWL